MSGFVTKPHNSLVSQKTFLHKFSGVGGWMLIDPLSQFNGGAKAFLYQVGGVGGWMLTDQLSHKFLFVLLLKFYSLKVKTNLKGIVK